jgi:CubicO group peptidase (beta-lactamase class C family)
MPRSLALVLLLTAAPALAQTPLVAGTPVRGELAPDGADAYELTLAAGQFVLGVATQHTTDVVVTVVGPDGETVGRFDESARGEEPFTFRTETAGAYTITVTPFEEEPGRYSLVLSRVEPVATDPEVIVRQLLAERSGPATPGAVVAVVRGGEIAFQEAFGMANLTYGIPYTLDTPTNIGSTSKQFTAFAVGLLAERGALSLDDDVRTHIPELPDLGETVTLRHLLTHTSGYREFLNTLLVAGRRLDEGDHIGRDEIIGIVQRQPRLQNTPGAEFNYNNTGYVLLSMVVERVSGQDFPGWMAENVFGPLAMTRTVVRAAPTQIVPGRAAGYSSGASGWREVEDLGGAMGAGGIYTTVGDLARWMANLQSRAIGGSVIEQMTTPSRLADGTESDYGLGLFVGRQNGHRQIEHGGADSAHRSAFELYPDLDLGVIVLTNAPASVGAWATRVARAFGGEAFDAEAAPEEAPADAPFAFDDARFDDLAGRYALDVAPDFILTFRRSEGGGYETQATGQQALEIVPTSDSTFVLTAVTASVTFHRDADGVVRSLTLNQGGAQRATRLDLAPAGEAAATPASPDLSAFAGRFWSEELDTAYTLSAEDGALVARHRRLDEFTLSHLRDDSFRGGGMTLTFERDAAGAVTAFVVDGGRARDIRFDRQP